MTQNQKQSLKDYFVTASKQAEVLGHELYFNCESYAFAGRVIDVEMDKYLVIEGAKWVFDTGKIDAKTWELAEKVPSNYWRIAIEKIESWGDMHRKL